MDHLPGYMTLILLCVGVIIGRFWNRKSRHEVEPVSPVGTCPCGHTIGEHEEGLACQADIRRPYYYSNGSRNGHEWVRCVCTRYYGPQPLIDLFHPGTLFPSAPPVDGQQ